VATKSGAKFMAQSTSQQIDELAEAVGILSGQLAALMAYVAVTGAPDQNEDMRVRGIAQQLAPDTPFGKTPPKRIASESVERMFVLAQQLGASPRP
jgi:hypothetical protein